MKIHAYRWTGGFTLDGRPHKHLGNHDLPTADIPPDMTETLTETQIEALERNPDIFEPMGKKAWEAYTEPEKQPKWFEDIRAKYPDSPDRADGETEASYRDHHADLLTKTSDETDNGPDADGNFVTPEPPSTDGDAPADDQPPADEPTA